VEPGHAVLQALQTHEGVACLDSDAFALGVDDEGADAAAAPDVLRHPRHHHDQLCDHAVGRPQLHPVEEICRAVLGRRRGGRHPSRVGPDVGLGEQERSDRAGGAPGQEPLLLLLGAEHSDRLGNADRLVRRHQRTDARMDRPDQHQSPAVVGHAEPEAAVLAGDLDPEGADLGQRGDVLVRDPVLALDALPVERLADRAQLH
jgi:hypothetical protein